MADFGTGDLAFAEVAQRLAQEIPDARVWPTAVPPFATLAAGFCVAQLALGATDGGRAPRRAVYHNVAPRRDDAGARPDNDGERLVHAELPGGSQVVGVHAGHAFSFLADAGAILRWVEVDSAGSQFRSRDVFPPAVAAALRGHGLGGAVPAEAVPKVPSGRLAYVDGFGNMKTTIDAGEAPEAGVSLEVTVAGVRRDARRAGGGFAVPHGELAFAPGSSGWAGADGRTRRWMELFLRGGSAFEAFERPAPESEIEVRVC